MARRARPPIVGFTVVVPGCAAFPHPLTAAVEEEATVVDEIPLAVEVELDVEVDVEVADVDVPPQPASSSTSDAPANH